jgi:predicted AlkP superfamily pyrophosphatase or phosphodiesterase
MPARDRHRAASITLAAVLLLLTAGARSSAPTGHSPERPIVVLVGLDGFLPRYLARPESRHLRELASEGVRARWLVPVFPTLTFPNFYTIATGLYPAHHGIVSNTIIDSVLGRFSLRDTAVVHDPRWWGGEPIWVTAVRQGRRAATFFWPGSDVKIDGIRPTYYKVFDPKVPNAERVRQVLAWLSLPPDQAPDLVTLYLGDVDDAGHQFGPDAPETDSAIARVDSAVGAIVSGVEEGGLSSRVDLVIVSDHGMAPVKPGHFIYLDDLIDTAAVSVGEVGAVVALSPRHGAGNDVYWRLNRAPHLKVYRKENIPPALHYRGNPRIAALIAVADEGWIVTTHAAVAARGGRLLQGMHGYPPDIPSMRAIFLAQGPDFKRGAVIPPFRNIHIYDLLTSVLCLTPAPNDGSLDSVRALLAPASKNWTRGVRPSCSGYSSPT